LGSLLLCKALPLTNNLVKFCSLKDIEDHDGARYADLCNRELQFLNSAIIHENIQTKMLSCVYGKESPYQNFRVNYNLVIKNVKEYNKMLEQQNYSKN
jgi:hypothetical protein